MTVKNMIRYLLEMPMDAEVVLGLQDEDGNYSYYEPNGSFVDYEDGTVGVLVCKEDKQK